MLARRIAHSAYRAVVGPEPVDQVPQWHGTVRADLPTLRVLHVGDCGIRSMEASHDFRAPLGFPRVTAEVLERDGIGMEFSHYFAVLFEYLPDMELLRRRLRLSGDPDVVLVQLGASYGRRLILPDSKLVMKLRCDFGRRLGRHVFKVYRVIRPVVRRVGRHKSAYPGPAGLESFLEEVRREWPEAHIVLMQPFERAHPYPTQLPIEAGIRADTHAVAERCDVAELDLTPLLGRDPSLRGANGYNLNSRGSEIVGHAVAYQIVASARPAGFEPALTARS